MNTTEVTETIGAVLLIVGTLATLAHLGVIEGSWSWSLKLVPRYKRNAPAPPRNRKTVVGTVLDSEPAPGLAVSTLDRKAASR